MSTDIKNQDTGMFTPEEQEILELTKKVRVDTLKKMVEKGVPERSGDIRVLVELSSSLDKVINDTATNRLKMQDTQNNKANAEMIVAAIMAKKDTNVNVNIDRPSELPDEVIEIEVVPGQTDINPAKLNPSEFLPQDTEE